MALLQSELERCKFELGFNLLTLSALPYAWDGVTQIFEQVVQPYLEAGEKNYSATAVVAAASPTQITLALQTTPTAILVGDRLIVDQDVQQEAGHVYAVTSSSVTVALANAHSGTYPLTVEGGESIIRDCLRQCLLIQQQISQASVVVGVKRADEVEFFGTTTQQMGRRSELIELQRYWRNELAQAIGVPNLREERRGSGSMLVNY